MPDEDSQKFVYDLQRQHVVFCGTEIMQGKVQSGDYCKAVVIRTGISDIGESRKGCHHCYCILGFMTTKGELVRSILFPPPLDFKFHSDFLKSVYVFLGLGLIGMSYSFYMWIGLGVSEKQEEKSYFC